MTPVEFHFVLPTGEPMANATVDIQLGRASHTGSLTGITMPRPISITTDANGRVVLNLWPSSTAYFVQVLDENSEAGIYYKFLVPEVAPGLTVRLQDIVLDAPMSGVFYDDVALLAIHEAKANAVAASISAAASAAEAAAAVVDMSGTISAAISAADAAALSEFNAAAKAAQAAESAATAGSYVTTTVNAAAAAAGSAAAANSSKDASAASAAAADSSKTAAAGSATTAATKATEAQGFRDAAGVHAGNAQTSANQAAASADVASQAAAAAAAVAVGDVVLSFNTRRGNIVLTGADVTSALGFTPYAANNPNGYVTANAAPVQSVFGRTGAITLLDTDITAALGYTPSAPGHTHNYLPLTGTAAAATKLATARSINGVPFDGTGDINISMGAGTFLPLVGGILSGDLQFDTAGRTLYANNFGTVSGTAPMDFINNGTTRWRNGAGSVFFSLDSASASFSVPVTINGHTAWHSGNVDPFRYIGWVGNPGADANSIAGNRSAFTYANNAPATGPLTSFAASGYDLQLNAPYFGGGDLWFRTRNGDSSTWNSWFRTWHSGNFDPANYAALSANNDFAGHVQAYGPFYARSDYHVLNSSGNGWWTLINRNSGNPIVTAAGVRGTSYIELADSNTRLTQGFSFSQRVSTPYGYIEVGPQNMSWAHIHTDRPAFYMNAGLNVQGALTQQGNQVWHAGNLADAGLMRQRGGTVDNSARDTATTTGMYVVGYPGYSSGLLVFNTGGSLGVLQMEAFYGGDIRFRNMTDTLTWSSWKTLLHTGNFNAANYAALSGAVFSGAVDASRLTSGYDSGQPGSVSCSNWFRSSGNTGWYNQTYNVGVWANDSNYVRVYGSAGLSVPGRIYGNAGTGGESPSGVGIGKVTVTNVSGMPAGGSQGDITWVY